MIEIRPYTKARLDGQVVEGSEKESPMSLPSVVVQADKLELAGNSEKQVYPATAVGPRRASSWQSLWEVVALGDPQSSI